MELPKEFKGTIYFYWNTKYEFFHISAHDLSSDGEYLFMGEINDVSVDFSVTHEDAVKQIVAGLQKEKTNIQAKAQSELNKIDEKINSLLAITHQVEGES